MTNPWRASLAGLPRQEGSVVEWTARIETHDSMGSDLMRVPEGAPLDIDLTFAAVSEGVYVSGRATAPVLGQCSRCLRDISGEQTCEIAELVFYPERREALVAEGDEEVAEAPVVVDDCIDLEPIVRDAIVLGLPFSPLCREDCSGLCPDCGQLWEELPDGHSHGEVLDPRFDVLAQLEAELKEGE